MREPSIGEMQREYRRGQWKQHPQSHSHGSRNRSFPRDPLPANRQTASDWVRDRWVYEGEEETDDNIAPTPWLSLVPQKVFHGVENRLHYEILAFASYMNPTPRELKMRDASMTCLRRIIHGRFTNARLDVFGSCATGLTLPDSDIDVVVTLPTPHSSIVEKKDALFRLANSIRRSSFAFTEVTVVHHAKVPIITLKTREGYGSLKMDIGINNPLGPEGIDFIKTHLGSMPALRPLILVVKGFLRHKELNDASKGGLGSFVLICMIISFLQAHFDFDQLNPCKRPESFITNAMGSESLGFLLTDLMFYYGLEFPYNTHAISLIEQKLVKKPDPNNTLAIFTPLDPTRNISKSLSRLNDLKQAFKDGYTAILQFQAGDEDLLGQIVRLSTKIVRNRLR